MTHEEDRINDEWAASPHDSFFRLKQYPYELKKLFVGRPEYTATLRALIETYVHRMAGVHGIPAPSEPRVHVYTRKAMYDAYGFHKWRFSLGMETEHISNVPSRVQPGYSQAMSDLVCGLGVGPWLPQVAREWQPGDVNTEGVLVPVFDNMEGKLNYPYPSYVGRATTGGLRDAVRVIMELLIPGPAARPGEPNVYEPLVDILYHPFKVQALCLPINTHTIKPEDPFGRWLLILNTGEDEEVTFE